MYLQNSPEIVWCSIISEAGPSFPHLKLCFSQYSSETFALHRENCYTNTKSPNMVNVKRKETAPKKITRQQILKNEQRQQRSAQIHISTITIMLLSVTLNAGEKHNKEKKVPLLRTWHHCLAMHNCQKCMLGLTDWQACFSFLKFLRPVLDCCAQWREAKC